MTLEEFNALVENAYEAAFAYEDDLIAVYLAAYQRQTDLAVKRFERSSLTASWTPPLYQSLTEGMSEEEKEEADGVRNEAAAAILAILAVAGISASSQTFLDAISDRAQTNFEQEILRNLRKIVQASFDSVLTAEATAQAIREQLPQVIPSSAQMLAQTELTALVNERTIVAAQATFPDGVSKTWLTVGDNRVRAAHAHAQGQTVPIDQPFSVGGASLMYPGDPNGPLGLVARCFPGDTKVAGTISGAMRSLHEGMMTTVYTRGGHRISGTENHPILTLSGWKCLGEIQEGDHLVRAGFDQRAMSGSPDIENVPSSISEVFNSLQDLGVTSWIPRSNVDFHGDIPTSDVEVVSSDSLLELSCTPPGFKPFEKFAFADSHISQTPLSGESLLDEFALGDDPSLIGKMSFGCETDSLLVGQFAHADEHGVRSVATLHPTRIKSFPDDFSAHVENGGNFLFRQIINGVETNDFINVDVDVPNAGSDVSLAQMVEDRSMRNTEALAELSGRESTLVVETDDVVRIESFPSHGDVFTLDTEQGYYIANGFVVKNCRCRLSYTNDPTAVTAGGINFDPASAQEDILMSTLQQAATSMTMTFVPSQITTARNAFATITISTDDSATTGSEAMEDGPAWRALLAVEGVATEDGRMLAEGSLTWRDLPLSLMAMDETTEGGHLGAKVAGRIDRIWRDGNEVWGEGVFNTDEFGSHIAELVSNQSLRGNSIDPAVTAYEYRDLESGEVLDGDDLMDAMMEDRPILTVFLSAIIMASTVCSTPAIGEANIMLASGLIRASWFQEQFPPEIEDSLTASAAGMAPLHPPAAWFDNPGFTELTPLTVTEDGRVMGHAAGWNICHIGEPNGPGVCVTPPRSGMGYEVFHHGCVQTAEGHDVSVGHITMSTAHAGSNLGWKAAQEHYDNSGAVVADVRAGEDRFGIWLSGALRPDLPAAKVREMKAGSISGDWRSVIGRGLEFISALIVNIPGFPVPRPQATIVASAAGQEEVESLVAAGIVECDCDEEGLSRRAYLRQIRALTN